MSDDDIAEYLRQVQGDDPSDEFVWSLRTLVDEHARRPLGALPDTPNEISRSRPPVELRPTVRRGRWLMLPLAAAAAIIALLFVSRVAIEDEPSQLETAAATPAWETGTSWLAAIEANDRVGFMSLHAANVEVNDTLMGYSSDGQFLTPRRVGELYLDGFDAFQRSVAEGGNVVQSGGCLDTAPDTVRCSYRTSLLGSTQYSYLITADMTVEDRRITAIVFETSTTPADLRSDVDTFFENEATDEDVACMVLGFNTLGCGSHDVDFIARYVEYYEAKKAAE